MQDSMTSIGGKSNTFQGTLLLSENLIFSPFLVVEVHHCPKIVLDKNVGSLYHDSTVKKAKTSVP